MVSAIHVCSEHTKLHEATATPSAGETESGYDENVSEGFHYGISLSSCEGNARPKIAGTACLHGSYSSVRQTEKAPLTLLGSPGTGGLTPVRVRVLTTLDSCSECGSGSW